MGKLTFKRGIHPDDHKGQTNSLPIKTLMPPPLLYFALQQHIGAPLKALVKPGDTVRMGQKLADSNAAMSVPLHSSVSGVVKDIGLYLHPTGTKMPTIVVENDGLDTPAEPISHRALDAMSGEEILNIIHEAGIVGMGGAGFPTHIKLSPPPEKTIRHIIVNGAECEPYLTSDHRVMLETPEEVLQGLSVVMRLFPQAQAHIAIEENKPDAIRRITEHAGQYPGVQVLTMRKKYPQGAEKQLIFAVTGQEIPSGSLPMDVGCVVLNIDTVTAIARAVTLGMPLYRRIVTVSGNVVAAPGNFAVRIGTPFRAVVEAAGGCLIEPGKIIMGGPMMGIAGYSLDVPVVKGTSSILLLTEQEARVGAETPCIRCGRCASVCPMHLRPLFLNAYTHRENWEKCREENILDCIECGCCAYVCPAKRHLVQSIRLGKQRAREKKS